MIELPPVESIYRALTATGIQVGFLILLVVVISLLFRAALAGASALPAMQGFQEQSAKLKRTFKRLLITLSVLLFLVIVGTNAYLLYREVDVLELTRTRIGELGLDFWIGLGTEIAKILALLVVAGLVLRWLRKILAGMRQRARAYRNIKANDESIDAFFTSLSRIVTTTTWLAVVYLSLQMLQFSTVASAVLLVLKIYLIIALGLLALKAVSAVVQSLDALVARSREPEKLLGLYDRLRELMPLMRRCLEAVIYVIVATLVLAQVDMIAPLAAYGPALIESIAIFFVVRVLVEISSLLVDKTMLEGKELDPVEKQGLATIVPVFKSILAFCLYFIGIVLILRALGINPLPLLAGAGVVGIVLGLGAQPLINDVVSGLFILFERLFLVGDFVETGGARGTVESVQLRTTRVRDPDGQLHILRNGQLADVVNFSKSYTNAVVEVGVAYDSNLDHVYEVLGEAGEQLREANPDVLQATNVQGVDDFGESELTIRTVTRVKPGRHRAVARQYRKLIKDAFDREGIEIPFARRVLIFQNEPESTIPPES